MALQANITVGLDLRESQAPDIGSANYAIAMALTKAITDGTGNGQANKVISDKRTLAPLGTVTYDLDSGTVAHPSGVASAVVGAMSRVVAIIAWRTQPYAANTQDEDVHIKGDFVETKLLGNTGSGSIADAVLRLGPAGLQVQVFPGPNGCGVTASTGDQITFENVSAADSAEIGVVIIGS